MKWVDECLENSVAVCNFYQPKGKRPNFVIELSRKRLDHLKGEFWIIMEAVMHEYAHALVWTESHRNLKDHGPLFGVAYAMLYEPTLKKFPNYL